MAVTPASPPLSHAPPSLGSAVPGGVLRRYGHDLGRLQRWLDALGVAALLPLMSGLTQGPWRSQEQALALGTAMGIALLAPKLGLYDSFRNGSHWSLLRRVFTLWLALVGLVSLALFVLKQGSTMSRELLLLWFGAAGVYLGASHVVSRRILRQLRVHGRNSRCDGYVGSANGYRRLAEEFEQASWLGHGVMPSVVWPEQLQPGARELELLTQRCSEGIPDQWLVEDPGDADLLEAILERLQDQPAPVLLLPRWLSGKRFQPRYCQLGGVEALELWGSSDSHTPLGLKIKRSFDWLAASFILLWWSPLLLAIAVAVKLDSPGPVLFRQRRYGLNGQTFQCLKFRTMRVQEDGPLVVQAQRHDPRITRVGAWLRRWNLDELPQLVNVWRGEMSLVGPRPHAAAHNELYRKQVPGYMRRHGLRPGLTGWAQVLGLRGETETLEKMAARVEADLDYIAHWSLLLDLKIFLLTFLRWRGTNAY